MEELICINKVIIITNNGRDSSIDDIYPTKGVREEVKWSLLVIVPAV